MLQAIGSHSSGAIRVGKLKVNAVLVRSRFAALLPAVTQDAYQAFISYRHGKFAADAVDAVYHHLSKQVLGHEKQVQVFRDSVDLKNGLPFDQSFLEAMLQTLVVVPLITPDTLKRMKTHESLNKVDHVLLEWWLALTLLATPGYPVLRIAPILCGTVWSTASPAWRALTLDLAVD